MSITEIDTARTFFANSALDHEMPMVNEVFWSALIGHIEEEKRCPRTVLDVGCHTGGLLRALALRFAPENLYGIEPLSSARSAAVLELHGLATAVKILDLTDWNQIPSGAVDLVTSHEVLYLESDLRSFMDRVHRVLAVSGAAYIVLGCHSENPLWDNWRNALVVAGHRVYDHAPLDIMQAASAAGFLPSVQPLRRSGWITYDPLRAEFRYPNAKMMLDHHYRHKLIFRLRVADDRSITA